MTEIEKLERQVKRKENAAIATLIGGTLLMGSLGVLGYILFLRLCVSGG